jgi:hypothetical protein
LPLFLGENFKGIVKRGEYVGESREKLEKKGNIEGSRQKEVDKKLILKNYFRYLSFTPCLQREKYPVTENIPFLGYHQPSQWGEEMEIE